jgi:hypothetical protein
MTRVRRGARAVVRLYRQEEAPGIAIAPAGGGRRRTPQPPAITAAFRVTLARRVKLRSSCRMVRRVGGFRLGRGSSRLSRREAGPAAGVGASGCPAPKSNVGTIRSTATIKRPRLQVFTIVSAADCCPRVNRCDLTIPSSTYLRDRERASRMLPFATLSPRNEPADHSRAREPGG